MTTPVKAHRRGRVMVRPYYRHTQPHAAPKPGERGYRAPPWGTDKRFDELAAELLNRADAMMDEPELAWAYQARAGEDFTGGEEVEPPEWTLADLIDPPMVDGEGKPLSDADRETIAAYVVDLAMESSPRWQGGMGVTDPRRPLPRWLAIGALADRLAAGASKRPRLVAVSDDEAADFIRAHHSHLPAMNRRGLLATLGVRVGDRLVAVAALNTPTGRWDRSERVQADDVVELTRVASDGSTLGAASMLTARAIDLLSRLQRREGAPGLFVTYQLVSEAGTTYRALREKGLRPTAYRPPKRQAEGSARTASDLGSVGKIRWEAGPAAGPADWSLVDPARLAELAKATVQVRPHVAKRAGRLAAIHGYVRLQRSIPRSSLRHRRPANKGGTLTLYRAGMNGEIRRGACLAEQREHAAAYQDNPGFGGPGLYRFNIPSPKYVLDLTGSPWQSATTWRTDVAEALLDGLRRLGESSVLGMAIDEDTTPGDVEAHLRSQQLLDRPYDVPEASSTFLRALGAVWDWIRYEDDFPAGCVTWMLVGEEQHHGVPIGRRVPIPSERP